MSTDTLQQAKVKPARSLPAKCLRFIVWTLLLLVLLMALALGIIYVVAGTDAGFSRLSAFASERVAGLSIEAPEGNLRKGMGAKSIEFANDAIDIQASELTTEWRLGCLLKRNVCLDNVHIDQLNVTTFATEETEPAVVRDGPIVLPDVQLPVNVIIKNVSIDTLNFQAPGDAPVQVINDIQLSANTEGSMVNIDNLSLGYQDFSARLNGTVELQGEYPLALLLNVQAEDLLPDTVPEGEGEQPLKVDMALSNSLANLSINTSISGLAELQLDATLQPLEQNLPATLSIVSESLGWPIESKSLINANSTRIDVSGDMSDYEFTVQTSLAGEQVPNTGINISGLANTERVSVPAIDIDTLGGSANASALVSLTQPLLWSTRWKIADIDPSIQVPDLQGNLNAEVNVSGMLDDARWSLKLERALINGDLRELPFRFEAKASKGLNDLWFIEQLTLNNDRNQIKAQGFISDELDINADINLPQLQNFLPGLAGGFTARLNAAGTLQNPDISLQADSEVIRFNDILIQALAINGDISELFTNTSSLDITVDTVRVGENAVSDTALSLKGQRTDHQLTLKADGPQDTDLDLSIVGNLDESLNWSGIVQKLQATVPEHDISLADPVAVSWQNDSQSVSVAPHCWSISGQSRLCLENQVQVQTGTRGQATITLDQYSLQQLNSFLPDETRVAGNLTSNIDLSWSDKGLNDSRAIVAATLNQAQVTTVDALGDPVSFGYDTIALDANATSNNAVVDLNLSSETLGIAQIGLQLDPSDPQSALEGSVNLNDLQLSIAQAFLPDFDTVSGTIGAQGTLGGTLTAPEFNGDIILDSPVLQAEILPLPITGGRITARVAGQTMTLDGQILSDEGTIELDGRGMLDPANWSAEVNLRGNALKIVSDPLQDSTVNHNIQIVANARRVSVSGEIDIPMALIDVAELPEGASTISSDIVIVEDEVAEPVGPASDLNLAVALSISLGDDVSLSAYGLDANLTGDMDVRIRGNRPPQLGGEITVVDGIFKKYGQDLLANGQILFVGPIDGTRLSIDAVREIQNEERTAGLRILGTVATPEITLFTDPADKSQDAILSYIILGRDINEASDQEADLLQTAALALAVKGGSKVGGGVAEALGIQEFGLETRGSGDNAELIVSGRINDRLLLRYGKDVFNSGSTLYLRYDLTKKLYLEAASAVGAATQNAVDLFYTFSF